MEKTIKLYTVKELSKLLQISEPTIRNWIMNKQIEFTRIGGSIRFTEEQVKNIIENGIKN